MKSALVVTILAVMFGGLMDWPTAAAAPPEYDVVVLDPPYVQTAGTHAADLDEFGNAIGWASCEQGKTNFFFNRADNSYQEICRGQDLIVRRMNNLGELVGDENRDAYYWSSPSADPQLLAPPPGDTGVFPYEINDLGVVAGVSFADWPDNWYDQPVVWAAGQPGGASAPVALPAPPGAEEAHAAVIANPDAAGVMTVAGWAVDIDFATMVGTKQVIKWEVAFDDEGQLCVLTGPTYLDTLDPTGSIDVEGMNTMGDIVGQSGEQAMAVPVGGAMLALPRLKSGGRTANVGWAHALNDNRDVVGLQTFIVRKKYNPRAVLWPGGKKPVDLNTRVALGNGATLLGAKAINNSGCILARAEFTNPAPGTQGACLLIPRE
jgi:hypothetical protein